MRMNIKKIALQAVLLALSVSAYGQLRFSADESQAMRKMQIALLAIENLYVDTTDTGKLAEDAIRGMISKLDTYYHNVLNHTTPPPCHDRLLQPYKAVHIRYSQRTVSYQSGPFRHECLLQDIRFSYTSYILRTYSYQYQLVRCVLLT